MKNRELYKIVAQTNTVCAEKDSRFNGLTKIVVASGMTRRKARKILLSMFCADYKVYYLSWWRCVKFGDAITFQDGTRAYFYDEVRYSIVPENTTTEN